MEINLEENRSTSMFDEESLVEVNRFTKIFLIFSKKIKNILIMIDTILSKISLVFYIYLTFFIFGIFSDIFIKLSPANKKRMFLIWWIITFLWIITKLRKCLKSEFSQRCLGIFSAFFYNGDPNSSEANPSNASSIYRIRLNLVFLRTQMLINYIKNSLFPSDSISQEDEVLNPENSLRNYSSSQLRAINILMLRRRQRQHLRNVLNSLRQQIRQQDEVPGIPQTKIDLLPITNYKKEYFEDNCPICMTEYHENDKLRTLPCIHSFHKECVDKWLLIKGNCPNCKLKID